LAVAQSHLDCANGWICQASPPVPMTGPDAKDNSRLRNAYSGALRVKSRLPGAARLIADGVAARQGLPVLWRFHVHQCYDGAYGRQCRRCHESNVVAAEQVQ